VRRPRVWVLFINDRVDAVFRHRSDARGEAFAFIRRHGEDILWREDPAPRVQRWYTTTGVHCEVRIEPRILRRSRDGSA
jgi:hypothetical protein